MAKSGARDLAKSKMAQKKEDDDVVVEPAKGPNEVNEEGNTAGGDLNTKQKEESETSGTTDDKAEAGSSTWMGWFSTTLTSAKEKSAEMYEYIKQDLTEFGDSVQEVSRDLKEKLKLEDTARSAVCTLGDTMNVVMDQVSTIFGVGPDDEDEEVPYLDLSAYRNNSKVQEKIDALAMEESIFSDLSRKYSDWAWQFNLEWPEDEMEELLASNPNLRLMYSTMVPAKTDSQQFWARYFYHVNMILKAEREAEKANIVQPKPQEDAEQPQPHVEEPLDKSFGADIVDISEEDQKRLLMEYEEEMKKGHSRGSSGTQLSSSSSGSFAFVTHDLLTDEVKVE